MAEHSRAVDPTRLGHSVGFLALEEMQRVEAALRLVLEL
jgi:hypothetical protein